MRILVDRLSDAPTDFRFEADSSWWRTHMRPGPGMPDGLDEPLQVGVRAHTMGEDLYFEGQLEGDLALECSRCLARYRHPLHEPFRLVLSCLLPPIFRTLPDEVNFATPVALPVMLPHQTRGRIDDGFQRDDPEGLLQDLQVRIVQAKAGRS